MTIVIFIAVLAVLIFTHELGHFIFAKKAGLRVDEFGFGFPPRLFGAQRQKNGKWRFILGRKKGDEADEGNTIYSVNSIPLGGFVRIYGEEGGGSEDKRSFSGQPIYIRALVLIAGVFFNLLLAWPILTAVFMMGAPVSVESDISGGNFTEKGVMILQVQENTPAEEIGLETGDYLLRLVASDNEILEVSSVKEVQGFISRHAGTEIQIEYLRGMGKKSVMAIPSLNPEEGKGHLGILMDKVGMLKLPFYKAVWEGLKTTVNLVGITAEAFADFFVDLFGERKMIAQVAGPVGIAGIVSGAAQSGFVYILQIVALLSINIALINFFPFPALDGGRLLFLLFELIKGKPISQKTSNIAHNMGFAILIILMLIITYRDILKIWR